MKKLIKLYNNLEKITKFEPDKEFWKKFAERQLIKMSKFSSARKALRTSQYKVHIKAKKI